MSSYQVVTHPGGAPELEPYMGLILTGWMSTLRFTNEWFKLIDEKTYYEIYPKVIRVILSRPDCQVSLAVLSEDPDVCLGFAVYQGSTLHYCFVKRDVRKQGIARALVPSEIKKLTHLTIPGAVIWNDKLKQAIFDPFLT